MEATRVDRQERRWFQFRLRTLLLSALLLALPLSWLAVEMKQARQRTESLAAARDTGARVYYAHDPIRWQGHDFEVDSASLTAAKPPGPPWLRGVLGGSFFDRVVSMTFPPQGTTNASLVLLEGLPEIQGVYLDNTSITDEGLLHLKNLAGLRVLVLDGTRITDRGLIQGSGLRQLESLRLADTQITDEGLVGLLRLRSLRLLCLEGTPITDAGLATLQSLPYLKEVHVYGTNVTQEGGQALTAMMPSITVVYTREDSMRLKGLHGMSLALNE